MGVFLALAGSTVLVLGLTWGGGDYPWSSPHVIVTLVLGVVVSLCFVLWEWKGPKYPLVARKSTRHSLVSPSTHETHSNYVLQCMSSNHVSLMGRA